MLRYSLIILIFLCFKNGYGQSEEIYRLTFSDKSNFKITTALGNKQPSQIYIINTTEPFYSKRFWLDGINLKSAKVLDEIKDDEHHPYHNVYLFKDEKLNSKFSDEEKKYLSAKAKLTKPKKINLKGTNYSTIKLSSEIKTFYFKTSEPIFSNDREYAFINFTAFSSKSKNEENYFSDTCVIYKRTNGKGWKKSGIVDRLIL